MSSTCKTLTPSLGGAVFNIDMIKPETYYEVTCDECGEQFSEGDTVIAFGSKEEAAEAVNEAGWSVNHRTERMVCPDCLEKNIRKDS